MRSAVKNAILLSILFFSLTGCEGTRGTAILAGNQNADFDTAQAKIIKLPTPNSSTKSVAIIYANNLKTYFSNLLSQFQTSIAIATDQGVLTRSEQSKIMKRVNAQHKLINRSANRYIKRANRVSANLASGYLSDSQAERALLRATETFSTSAATFIKLSTPFAVPVKVIPKAGKKGRLKSIRKQLGNMDSYDGFGIYFVNSLTTAIKNQLSLSAAQTTLVERIDAKLVGAFTKDIKSIARLVNIVNTRRFKTINKAMINPTDFVGTYTGECYNFTSGQTESIGASIAYDENTKVVTLSFVRPDNLFGSSMAESFQGIWTDSGVSFDQVLNPYGHAILSMTKRGFIKGRLIDIPVSGLDKVNFWGNAKASDNSIILDIRIDFPDLDQGGQAHAQLTLNKTS